MLQFWPDGVKHVKFSSMNKCSLRPLFSRKLFSSSYVFQTIKLRKKRSHAFCTVLSRATRAECLRGRAR